MLLLDGTRPGVCVQCGGAGGAGLPCHTPACQTAGYACLPTDLEDDLGEPRADDLHIGLAVEEYVLARKLGQGGMGAVFLALQRPIGLKVALKFIEGEVSDPEALARFRSEASALASLSDPHIVRLIKFGIWHNAARRSERPYLVMEHIDGGQTLAVLLRQGVDLVDAVDLVDGVVMGAHAMHCKALIHRDLKPANIMVQTLATGRRMVRLIDFGIAKNISAGAETTKGIGTAVYMPPEQFRARDLGPWSDYYAIGVIATELLVGRNVFQRFKKGGPDAGIIDCIEAKERFDEPTALAFLQRALARPDVPPSVLAFVLGALAAEPRRRLSDPRAFMNAFRAAAAALTGRPPIPRVTTADFRLDATMPSSAPPRPVAPSSDGARPLGRGGQGATGDFEPDAMDATPTSGNASVEFSGALTSAPVPSSRVQGASAPPLQPLPRLGPVPARNGVRYALLAVGVALMGGLSALVVMKWMQGRPSAETHALAAPAAEVASGRDQPRAAPETQAQVPPAVAAQPPTAASSSPAPAADLVDAAEPAAPGGAEPGIAAPDVSARLALNQPVAPATTAAPAMGARWARQSDRPSLGAGRRRVPPKPLATPPAKTSPRIDPEVTALRSQIEAALKRCECISARKLATQRLGALDPQAAAGLEARLKACPMVLPGTVCVDGRVEMAR